jgi:hypothetical protein
MNADQIRAIVQETIRQELAAFFAGAAPVVPVVAQDARDQIAHALNLPRLMAETQRQRAESAARRARKDLKRAA